MSIKTKAAVLVASFAVLLFTVVGGFVGVRASSNDGAYRQLQVYSEVLSRMRSEYVEDPKITTVTEGALHGLLESLDANSSYLSADEYKHFKQIQSNGKAGMARPSPSASATLLSISVIPGGPADKAGLVGSDIIEAIESKSTRDMSLAEIRTMLAGETGSTITVSVVRPRRAEPQKIVITRDVVTVPAVSDKVMPDNVGYIKVDAFTKGKSQEVAAKLRSLQKDGAKRLVHEDDTQGRTAPGSDRRGEEREPQPVVLA